MKIHFSIDDVISVFDWLERNEANSVFEAELFKLVQELYIKHDIKTTLNVMYMNAGRNLSLEDISDRYRAELLSCKDWIRYSFHAYDENADYSRADYKTVMDEYVALEREIKRITGCELSPICRIHRFLGNSEVVQALKECGVKILLTADDDRASYDLTKEEKEYVNNRGCYERLNDGMIFQRTHMRLECMKEQKNFLNNIKSDAFVFFTHEYEIMAGNLSDTIDFLCDALRIGKSNLE